jgi:hypothetical protein
MADGMVFDDYARARGPHLTRIAYLLTHDRDHAEDLVTGCAGSLVVGMRRSSASMLFMPGFTGATSGGSPRPWSRAWP